MRSTLHAGVNHSELAAPLSHHSRYADRSQSCDLCAASKLVYVSSTRVDTYPPPPHPPHTARIVRNGTSRGCGIALSER
eukprot:4964832-Prymnesium_polylepis.1